MAVEVACCIPEESLTIEAASTNLLAAFFRAIASSAAIEISSTLHCLRSVVIVATSSRLLCAIASSKAVLQMTFFQQLILCNIKKYGSDF